MECHWWVKWSLRKNSQVWHGSHGPKSGKSRGWHRGSFCLTHLPQEAACERSRMERVEWWDCCEFETRWWRFQNIFGIFTPICTQKQRIWTKNTYLGGDNSKYFLFSPRTLWKWWNNLTSIFFQMGLVQPPTRKRLMVRDEKGIEWSKTHYAGGYTSYFSLPALQKWVPPIQTLEEWLEPHIEEFRKEPRRWW